MLFFFFFNDTATTEIYTLSLHDALPISGQGGLDRTVGPDAVRGGRPHRQVLDQGRRPLRVDGSRDDRHRTADRKSTRLNSSHANISYAVFCLKKKKNNNTSLMYRLYF